MITKITIKMQKHKKKKEKKKENTIHKTVTWRGVEMIPWWV